MKKRFTLFVALFVLLTCNLFAASGGPDAYGYVWRDSNDPLGPTPMWMDTTALWTRVLNLADDNSVGPFNMLWDFHYYWGDYNNFRIGSNGWISFDNVSNIASCFPGIPTPGGAGDNYVAPLMSDLNFVSSFLQFPNPAKCYYWSNLKDTLVVSFYNVPWWQTGTPDWFGSNTFQVLFDGTDSSITYTYQTMNATFANTGLCNTDLVIGIENSTGAVGLECWREILPLSNYAIKFKYPVVPLLAVKDLAPLWNQNVKNAADFFPTGLIPNLRSDVKNVGNTAFSNSSTIGGTLRNLSYMPIYTASRTLPTWAAAMDTNLIFTPQAVVNTPGQYYWEVTANNTADMNPGNNTNTSEIELVNLLGPTAQLTYTTGGGNTYAWGWNGGGTDDGVGVYMYPPVHPLQIQSMQVFIASASVSGYIVSIFDDSGPNGAPGVLLKTDTIPNASVQVGNWNTVTYSVPININSGGYYVAWMMGGADIFIGTEDVGPISRRSYEVLSGQWSGFRDNNLRELMIRVNIGGYPCANTAGFNYAGNLTTVSFTNQSTGGTTYHWDFGDGSTSTSLSPNHTYATFGTYTVCLISTNTCGSDTICMPVLVTCPLPVSAFTNTSTGLAFQFTDASGSNPTSWHWDFGDGATSTSQNPSHTYATAGTFNVCLISTNSCGTDTVCHPVSACGQSAAGFGYTLNGMVATFSNSSTNATTYFWSFGDGINGFIANPTHTYATAGVYTVCLIASNACFSDTICLQVTVCPFPNSGFTFIPNQFVVAFTDNTPGTNTGWAWTFGDGGTSAIQNPSHTYAANGTYNVCLTVTNSCGADTICHSVIINVVGVADMLSAENLHLWPNPAGNMLQVGITLTSPMDIQVAIRDMAGRLTYLSTLSTVSGEWSTQLDITSLASGMYMLELQSQDLHIMKKFVKE